MIPDFIDRDISGILDADFAHFPSQYQPFLHGFLPPLSANRARYVELKKILLYKTGVKHVLSTP
jgi:hypothetical protein